MSRRLR